VRGAADRPLSASNLGQKKTSVHPSVKKHKLRARARLCGADVGDDRQILRYKLCNFVGIEIFGS
jgi:hypothetical protein